MSDDDLLSYLQQVPSLVHLHCSSPVSTRVLRALTPSVPTSSQACLCPKLTFIELKCWRPFDTLVEMVERRWCREDEANSVCQLKTARFHLYFSQNKSAVELELIQRLFKCHDEGLDIKCNFIVG